MLYGLIWNLRLQFSWSNVLYRWFPKKRPSFLHIFTLIFLAFSGPSCPSQVRKRSKDQKQEARPGSQQEAMFFGWKFGGFLKTPGWENMRKVRKVLDEKSSNSFWMFLSILIYFDLSWFILIWDWQEIYGLFGDVLGWLRPEAAYVSMRMSCLWLVRLFSPGEVFGIALAE